MVITAIDEAAHRKVWSTQRDDGDEMVKLTWVKTESLAAMHASGRGIQGSAREHAQGTTWPAPATWPLFLTKSGRAGEFLPRGAGLSR